MNRRDELGCILIVIALLLVLAWWIYEMNRIPELSH